MKTVNICINLLRNTVTSRGINKSKNQYYAEYFSVKLNNIKNPCDGIRKIVNI